MPNNPEHVDVVVDALIAQGQGNVAVRLVAAAPGQDLPAFQAGAHIDLHLPGGLIRQYSLASAPHQREYYLLCVRHQANSRGGSRYVHERLRVGDRLTISTPRNLFALEPGAAHSVLLAGGIGITPLLSMAWALELAQQPFALHYYVRDRSEIAFARQWRKGFNHGEVHLHCSSEGASARSRLPADLVAPRGDAHIYCCGPDGFMAHLRAAALSVGWNETQWHQEAFGAESVPVGSSEALDDRPFEVELSRSKRVFVVEPGQTIGHVLRDAGVSVPLSCEMGICGACLTPVCEGQVDHRDSVQSDDEKSAQPQHIALCCSRSLSPRLVLDF